MKRLKLVDSMKIRTIIGAKNKYLRLEFTHYIVEKYGLSFSTAYTWLRYGKLDPWMIVGIRRCINEFLEDEDYTDFENFFENLPVKSEFVRFMSNRGMCEKTLRSRFGNFNFSELEQIGLETVYENFITDLINRG